MKTKYTTPLLAILLLLFFGSCEEKNKKIVDREKMIDIMVDMHLSDATLKIYNLRNAHTAVNQSHYDSIFLRHGITDHLFKWNIAFYTYKKELDQMMDQVVTKLNKVESDVQKRERDLENQKRKENERVRSADSVDATK